MLVQVNGMLMMVKSIAFKPVTRDPRGSFVAWVWQPMIMLDKARGVNV